MSYATPPPPTRPRPAVVTASSALLIALAALNLVGFITTVSQAGTISDVTREAAAGTELEGAEGVVVATTIGVSAFMVLLAVGLVVLAILNAKGKNPSRIVTWVLGGFFLCCSGGGLLLSGITSGVQPADTAAAGGFDQEAYERALSERLPDWFEPLGTVINIAGLVILIVALILLALPAANEFFRKQPEPPHDLPPPAYPPVS